LERAVALYQGKLLPNCYDEWIEPEQERLHQACIRVYTWLIQQLQTQQDYSVALRHAQQLLRIDPLNEAAYASLMQLYALSGDRANAFQTYHRCMSVLREELGVDPSASTRKFYERLLLEDEAVEDRGVADEAPRMQVASHHPSSLPPVVPVRWMSPLVGREREWATIQQWVNAKADYASEVLLVVGEPGIGKTRLLEELRATMQADQVLWGRGFAAEMVRPYGIWTDALRSLAIPPSVTIPPELSFLLPEMGQPTKTARERSHLFDAVVQLIAEWTNQAPLVVIFDDIQWIDEASSALLHYTIRLLGHLPVRFAYAGRSEELEENPVISRVVQALRRERRLRTLKLQPFDRAQTAELIRTVQINFSNLSVEAFDQVFTDSGGNPLFALEVARALSQNQSAHANDLEGLIGDRLQRLDDGAREVLPWAAALGRNFNPTIVAQVANYPLPQLLMAIEQLERQNIIRPSTGAGNEIGYDFAHNIVRQVVYQQLSEPLRHLIHMQIAHKLNQLASSDNALASDIAHHASLGGDHELAASAALLAAERCLKLFAYAEASKLAQQGIQHSQRLDSSSRVRLQIRLLKCYILAGVTKEQIPQLEATLNQLIIETIALNLKDEEAIALEVLMALSYDYDNLTSVHQHSLQAAERVRLASSAVMARTLAHSGWCLAEIERDMDRAEALLLEAQLLATRVGLEIGDISCGLGCVRRHAADFAGAHLLLEQAWHMAQVEQDHWRECACLSYLAMVELEADHPLRAVAYSTELAIVATKISGDGSEGAMAAALTALANYQLQQPEADAALGQAIATLQQVDAKRMLAYVLTGAAEVDLEEQRPRLAVHRAETALQAAQIIKHPSAIALAWAISIRGFLALDEREQAATRFELFNAETDRHTLSVRARAAVEQVIQQIQPIICSRQSSDNA
jgi:hypothetical protein